MSSMLASDTASRAGRFRRAPVLWPWALAALAWTLAVLATLAHQRYLIDHHWLLEESGLPFVAVLAIFLACWQVMTAGMMLPSSVPIMTLQTYAARKQPHTRRILAVFTLAYALVWAGFAVGALIGDSFIHRAVDSWPWLAEHWTIIGAGTFALAGVYQFSPLKDHCLRACRTPLGFFVRFYRAGVAGAWRLGLRHGLFCLGCCWTLMLVMFGVGVGGLGWMAALTGVMVVEKAVPGGNRLTPVVGVALLLLAVLWLMQPGWLGATGV